MATESSSRSSVSIAQQNINDDSRSTYNLNRSDASRGSIRKINFEDLTCPCERLRMYTSTTSDNPGRRFIRCPLWRDGCNFFQWEDDFARNLLYFHLKHIKPQIPGGMGDVVEAPVEAKHVEDDGQNKKITRLRTKLEEERKKSHFFLVNLCEGSPLPPVYALWRSHRSEEAREWEGVVADRIRLFQPFLPESHTIGETIELD
ncbi:hypothetical protein RIF29_10962 [Crotalaria pallida]|uniref:GRF-type domain-containing protein n=1 Tax=Crotalaria pallida TaxID=3830 RepID=A0AAN9FZF5_CROPI